MIRRTILAATIALAAAGSVGAAAATADTSAVRTSSGGEYIACAGVRTVNIAVCVEEPVGPILDRLP